MDFIKEEIDEKIDIEDSFLPSLVSGIGKDEMKRLKRIQVLHSYCTLIFKNLF